MTNVPIVGDPPVAARARPTLPSPRARPGPTALERDARQMLGAAYGQHVDAHRVLTDRLRPATDSWPARRLRRLLRRSGWARRRVLVARASAWLAEGDGGNSLVADAAGLGAQLRVRIEAEARLWELQADDLLRAVGADLTDDGRKVALRRALRRAIG